MGLLDRLFGRRTRRVYVPVLVEPMPDDELNAALMAGRDTPLYRAICQVIDGMQSEAALEATGLQARGETVLLSGAVASMNTLALLRSELEERMDAIELEEVEDDSIANDR